jgi:hypothetical protein
MWAALAALAASRQPKRWRRLVRRGRAIAKVSEYTCVAPQVSATAAAGLLGSAARKPNCGSDLAIRCIAGITVGLDSILRLPRRPHADPRLCRVPRGCDADIREGLAQRMKRTRHKRTPSVRRRALEFIAAHPGCTEALLAAENIPAEVLIELVQSGLVIARIERLDDEDGAVEVTCAWITATGERVLAARG